MGPWPCGGSIRWRGVARAASAASATLAGTEFASIALISARRLAATHRLAATRGFPLFLRRAAWRLHSRRQQLLQPQ